MPHTGLARARAALYWKWTQVRPSSSSNAAASPRKRRRRTAEAKEELKAKFTLEEAKRRAIVKPEWLSSTAKRIHSAHAAAVDQHSLNYDDPSTGYFVMTSYAHFLRGRCCGNACRHCIFGHQAVPVAKRGQKSFNSSFWQ